MSIITKSTLRKSGYVFSFMFFIIFVLLPFIIHSKINLTALISGLVIFIISFINPFLLRKPYIIWIKIGILLGEVNSKVILGFFFYIFITPFSILRNIVKFLLSEKYNKRSFYKKVNKNTSNFEDQY